MLDRYWVKDRDGIPVRVAGGIESESMNVRIGDDLFTMPLAEWGALPIWSGYLPGEIIVRTR